MAFRRSYMRSIPRGHHGSAAMNPLDMLIIAALLCGVLLGASAQWVISGIVDRRRKLTLDDDCNPFYGWFRQ